MKNKQKKPFSVLLCTLHLSVYNANQKRFGSKTVDQIVTIFLIKKKLFIIEFLIAR